MELKNLTAKQLDELVAAADRRKTELAREAIATAKARIQKILADIGMSLEELFGKRKGAAGKSTRAKVAPKYRNPQDASQTWSGRGLKPRWMVAALKGGKKPEDFAIGVGAAGAKAKKPGRGPAKKVPAKKVPAKAAKKSVKAKAAKKR